MRNMRTIGKHRTSLKLVGTVAQIQLSVTTGDVLNRIKRKLLTTNYVIAGRMFEAAADNGEFEVPRRVQVEIKSSRLGDLGRKELRFRSGNRSAL